MSSDEFPFHEFLWDIIKEQNYFLFTTFLNSISMERQNDDDKLLNLRERERFVG